MSDGPRRHGRRQDMSRRRQSLSCSTIHPNSIITINYDVHSISRVLYTGAHAHCGSYVCVVEHRRPQSVVRTTRPMTSIANAIMILKMGFSDFSPLQFTIHSLLVGCYTFRVCRGCNSTYSSLPHVRSGQAIRLIDLASAFSDKRKVTLNHNRL